MSVFRSFQNVPILNQPAKPATREEMAADLAAETCERYKVLRQQALDAEANAEPSLQWNDEAKECIETIEALMKGPHRWVVVPVILEHLPELVTQPKDDAAQKKYIIPAEQKLFEEGDALTAEAHRKAQVDLKAAN